MNVGYLSLPNHSAKGFISWEKLQKQEVVEEYTYFKHIRFKEPLQVIMDGKKMIGAIVDNVDATWEIKLKINLIVVIIEVQYNFWKLMYCFILKFLKKSVL